MPFIPKPVLLLIFDGWGYREDPEYNAIAAAKKPVWDRIWQENPHTLIHASQAAVGLPANQMGNSEVGHLNIGAGRVVYQEYSRINRAIKSGRFFENKVLTDACDQAMSQGLYFGVYPGLTDEMRAYVGDVIDSFMTRTRR